MYTSGDLVSLIQEHTLFPVSLPCRLLIRNEVSSPQSTLSGRQPRSLTSSRPPVAKRSSSLVRDSVPQHLNIGHAGGHNSLSRSTTPTMANHSSLPRHDLDNLSIASSTCSSTSSQNSAGNNTPAKVIIWISKTCTPKAGLSACLVLYVSYGAVENLTGNGALGRASVDPEAVIDPVILKIKVNPKGVTLTDTKRRSVTYDTRVCLLKC